LEELGKWKDIVIVGNDPLSGIEIEKKIMETKVPSYVSEHHIETTGSC